MSDFIIERPAALYALFLLVPALVFLIVSHKKTSAALVNEFCKNDFNKMKRKIAVKIFFRVAAWIMFVFAFAGISWGRVAMPVQKNGSAVSLVFDISYSMTARDAHGNYSRLEAASLYAGGLLNYIEGSPVSAVIAKGGGVLAVPLTEDLNSVRALIESLSPSMMSAAGSNLGEGILVALKSIPSNVAKKPVVWLFTDGEESEPSMLNALNAALRQGVSVVIIGFGSEREIEITAGDGATQVKTALRSENIRRAVEAANKNNFGAQGFGFFKGAEAKYVAAADRSSALAVLDTLWANGNGQSAPTATAQGVVNSASAAETMLAYESQPIARHGLFIFLAVLFFVLSFVASEFSPSRFKESLVAASAVFLLASCSPKIVEGKKILEASWNWRQKDYNSAVADFSQALSAAEKNGDDLIRQYALYGLSATYIQQNEYQAAAEKIEEIAGDAPDRIRFASYYNSGIIAHRSGEHEKAAGFFKQALLIDSSNINAKINLEISLNQMEIDTRQGEQTLSAANEISEKNSVLEKSVFNRIRENEQRQWKNFQQEQKGQSVLDY